MGIFDNMCLIEVMGRFIKYAGYRYGAMLRRYLEGSENVPEHHAIFRDSNNHPNRSEDNH